MYGTRERARNEMRTTDTELEVVSPKPELEKLRGLTTPAPLIGWNSKVETCQKPVSPKAIDRSSAAEMRFEVRCEMPYQARHIKKKNNS